MVNKKDDNIKDLLTGLLKPAKTFRDAVQGDIKLTKLEVNIIDTKDFQRLRGIKQLGTTYLVYHCAHHTRFEHSLGCLSVAQDIIDAVDKNPYPDKELNQYDRFIIRLCALIHDIVYIPFGHTLEDEGNLFDSQWKDKDRCKHFLNEKRGVGKVIMDNKILNELNKLGRSEFNPKNVIERMKDIFISLESKQVEKNPYAYVCDIVGNTLCADLLDYVRRDFYFTGLREDYDERFLSYLYLTTYNKRKRLVLRLTKPTTGTLRRDVRSELLHLVRLRYSLAEKVYYHHTKIASSAMLIAAVNDMIQNNLLRVEKLYDITEDDLLNFIEENGTGIAKYLIKKLRRRQIYKPVYGLKYTVGDVRKEKLIKEFRDKNNRWKMRRRLEVQGFGTLKGKLVLYCSDEDMGYKTIETIVNKNDDIRPLNIIAEDRVKEEIKTSIIQKHLELWGSYVFVDPETNLETRVKINGDCTSAFGKTNELDECICYESSYPIPYPVRLEDEFAKKFQDVDRLSDQEAIEFYESIKTSTRIKDITDKEIKYSFVTEEKYFKERKTRKK